MDSDSKEQHTKKSASNRITPGPDIRKYVENRIELFSITVAEQIAFTVSTSIQKFIGLLFLSFGIVFLWIALGFFLGELLNSQALGFFLASLPLLILGFIFYNRSSKNLEQKIQSDIIEKIALNFEKKTASLADPDNDKKKLN
ncbi:phage holin family protein [Rhodohalobacter sp. 8-1]|uniref:phage holin family protein n=1 Tax=Rhodohalobacter sp. 8-1 TaxID=3131972 RepID=UPI0030EBECD3